MRSFTEGAASMLLVELALEAVAGDCREGWTVLCGFEYWAVNRFFGIRRLNGGW